MYHILESENGQPIILWQSGNTLQKYTIRSGRIFNRGTLIRDINRDFRLWDTTPTCFSYESVDGSTVITEFKATQTREVFINHCNSTLLEHLGRLIVFSLEPLKDGYNLVATTSADWGRKKIILQNQAYSDTLCAVYHQESYLLFLEKKLLILSDEFQIRQTYSLSAASDFHETSLQKEVSRLKYELNQMKQQHADLSKEYHRLSAYTGELQEQLRKTRLHIR